MSDPFPDPDEEPKVDWIDIGLTVLAFAAAITLLALIVLPFFT